MNKNKNIKIAFILNIINAILTLIASIMMFTGFKFMKDYLVLESSRISMLKFFTVESNILMGLVSLLFAYKEYNVLKGTKKELTRRDYIIKLSATSAVALTFFVVFLYLGPITEYGMIAMIANSNLFFHLIIPVLSMITFIFFEKTNKIDFKYTLFGVFPALLYAIFYISNIIFHMENGKVSPVYDWYWFVQNGVWTAFIVAPIIFIATYIISFLLWKFNRITKEK